MSGQAGSDLGVTGLQKICARFGGDVYLHYFPGLGQSTIHQVSDRASCSYPSFHEEHQHCIENTSSDRFACAEPWAASERLSLQLASFRVNERHLASI